MGIQLRRTNFTLRHVPHLAGPHRPGAITSRLTGRWSEAAALLVLHLISYGPAMLEAAAPCLTLDAFAIEF
jgi:hypothetical protein